jgi:hypothetical protein
MYIKSDKYYLLNNQGHMGFSPLAAGRKAIPIPDNEKL